MKKITASLLVAAIIVSMSACGVKNESSAPATSKTQSVSQTSDQKILTIYFSSANTADVDAVSSATPSFDGSSATATVATYINNITGGDIAKITPVNDYPTDYNGTADAAKSERDRDERPEFLPLDIDPEDYDVIFVGYPMWWYTLPMVMYTFFDAYDFTGKTIIPFDTHAGSGDGGTFETIKEFEPGATVLEGIAVSGSRADKSEDDVKSWLEKLGF